MPLYDPTNRTLAWAAAGPRSTKPVVASATPSVRHDSCRKRRTNICRTSHGPSTRPGALHAGTRATSTRQVTGDPRGPRPVTPRARPAHPEATLPRPQPHGAFMSSTQVSSDAASDTSRAAPVPLRFEAAVLPVADVDSAKVFYQGLGWRLED